MLFSYTRAGLVATALLAATGCAGTRIVPPGAPAAANVADRALAVDTTPVLKLLTKNAAIGSTIDLKNGDKSPHGVAIAPITNGLSKGQLLVCNFNNKANGAGMGTTIEVLDPKAGSKPSTFAQSAKIEGCGALAVTGGDELWVPAFKGKTLSAYDPTGKSIAALKGAQFAAPFGAVYAQGPGLYPPTIVFVGDASTGTISRTDISNFPSVFTTVVVTGFAVNKKSGTSALGPSGLQYNKKTDTLYVVDGASNTVVSFSNASKILLKNAVAVQPGGKTFKYAKGQPAVAKLVYGGAALKAPVASALLPNGNLIVANTAGNGLVEMTPIGQVLDTKVVDTRATPGIFGLVASGTSDANTVLYYTDSNSNTLQQLAR